MARGSPFLLLAFIPHASACEFYVTAVGCCPFNEAFVGNWIRDGGPWHKSKRMYKHVDNYQQVFQWAGNAKGTWDMCRRDAETGPSTCGENSAGTSRSGYTNNGVDRPSGNIKNWCSQSNCVFKVRAPPCPTSTSTSTATTTNSTTSGTSLTSTAEMLDVSTKVGLTSTAEMLDLSTAAGSAEFYSTSMAAVTSTQAWASSSTVGLESSSSEAESARRKWSEAASGTASLAVETTAVPQDERMSSTPLWQGGSTAEETSRLPGDVQSSSTEGSAAVAGETSPLAGDVQFTSAVQFTSTRGDVGETVAGGTSAAPSTGTSTFAGGMETSQVLLTSTSEHAAAETSAALQSSSTATSGPVEPSPRPSGTVELRPLVTTSQSRTTLMTTLAEAASPSGEAATRSSTAAPESSSPEQRPSTTASQGSVKQLLEAAQWQSLPGTWPGRELSRSSPLGRTLAAKLYPLAGAAATVSLGDVSISVPSAVLQELLRPGEEPVLMAVLFSPELAPPGAKGVMSIELGAMANSSIRGLQADDLPEPIALSLPLAYQPQLTCAFYDEKAGDWSTAGVSTGSGNKAGEPMVCETKHLSLFAAIVQGALATLACSQASLLSQEAITALASGDWYGGKGSVFFWAALGAFLLAFLAAAALDRRRPWAGRLFLLVRDSVAQDEEEEGAMERTKEEAEDAAKTGCACLAGFAAIQGSSALQDACDDIMSNWCDYFGEVRSCLADTMAEMDVCALSLGRVLASLRKVMHGLDAGSARRLAGASLGLEDAVLDFLLEDDDFKDLLAERQGRSEADFGERERAWFALYTEVCEAVEEQLVKLGSRCAVCTCLRLFLANHFAVRLFYLDVFQERRTRLLLCLTDQLLQLTLATFFFEAAGGRRRSAGSADGCDDMEEQEGFGQLIGRFMVIAAASAIFASLPMNLLESLQTKSIRKVLRSEESKVLRAWRLQSRIIYVLSGLLICFSLFFIHLFLANVSDEDQEDWLLSLCLVLLQDWVVVPLAFAFVYPLLSRLLWFFSSRSLTNADLQHAQKQHLQGKTNLVFHPL